MQKPSLLLGAHTSAAGGVHNALLQGQQIGATTIQLFTANQRRWESKPIADEEIELWKKTLDETGIKEVMSHSSYLINLGAPDSEILSKSRKAFREEIERARALNLAYINFHPGAAISESKEQCLERIVESLLQFEPLLEGCRTRLLLEATAGQGSCVGCKFEELAYILERVKDKVCAGVCIDTCHIFVSGYDIRTPADWEQTLGEFDRVVGLKHLYAFHLNDSVKPLGSKVDRHAALGKGEIGLECFKFLTRDKRTSHLPMYLETPDGPELWVKEIAMLREFAIT